MRSPWGAHCAHARKLVQTSRRGFQLIPHEPWDGANVSMSSPRDQPSAGRRKQTRQHKPGKVLARYVVVCGCACRVGCFAALLRIAAMPMRVHVLFPGYAAYFDLGLRVCLWQKQNTANAVLSSSAIVTRARTAATSPAAAAPAPPASSGLIMNKAWMASRAPKMLVTIRE